MYIVVREHRLPRATVELLEVGAEHVFPYQVWWRPDSNVTLPVLCSARTDRQKALDDLRWVAEGVIA